MNTIEQEFNYVIKVINSCTNIAQLEYTRRVSTEFKQRWTSRVPITDSKLPRMIETIRNTELKKYNDLSTI
jgi:hypothetical protein